MSSSFRQFLSNDVIQSVTVKESWMAASLIKVITDYKAELIRDHCTLDPTKSVKMDDEKKSWDYRVAAPRCPHCHFNL